MVKKAVSCGAVNALLIDSVNQIPSQYKAILMDQFGVLHDGNVPYPGAISAVEALAGNGKKVLIISNSSRRSSGALSKLKGMGFPEEAFAGAVTSGEVAHQALLNRQGEFWEQLGRRCLHLTWGARGSISLEGLNLQVVDAVEDADFVMAHGTESLGRGDGQEPTPITLDQIRDLLATAAGRDVPLLIANPDLVTVDGKQLRVMPGTFGKWYSEMGGKVCLLGKPAPVIYQTAMQLLGLESPADILAIGDSLEHDIAGAHNAGCDSAFVPGGIHAEELGITENQQQIDADKLESLLQKYDVQPTFVMPFLQV